MDFTLKFTIVFLITFYFLFFLFQICQIVVIKKRILRLITNEKEISPNTFFMIHNTLNRKQENKFFYFDYSYWSKRNS